MFFHQGLALHLGRMDSNNHLTQWTRSRHKLAGSRLPGVVSHSLGRLGKLHQQFLPEWVGYSSVGRTVLGSHFRRRRQFRQLGKCRFHRCWSILTGMIESVVAGNRFRMRWLFGRMGMCIDHSTDTGMISMFRFVIIGIQYHSWSRWIQPHMYIVLRLMFVLRDSCMFGLVAYNIQFRKSVHILQLGTCILHPKGFELRGIIGFELDIQYHKW